MNLQNTLFGYFFNAFRHGYGFQNAQNDYPKWRELLAKNRTSVSEELPWINFPAFHFLEKEIKSGSRVFEFGGGGSTLYFLKKVGEKGQVATVEHDENWMKILTENVEKRGHKNWAGQFVAPEKRPENEKGNLDDPAFFGSKSPEFGLFSFKNYAKAIEKWPDEHFDLVLVDGRSRISCIAESLKKVKCGGLLAIDNAERTRYLEPFRAEFERDFSVEIDERGPTLFHPSWTVTLVLRRV